MIEKAKQELAAENPDSDAAIILSQAIEEARVTPGKQADILRAALGEAQDAKTFSPKLEAPLPEGWPRPSLPGLIRIKSYPAVRAAWVRGTAGDNSQFMTLFRHIQNRDIAMTGPVIMGYPEKPAPNQRLTTDSMAFLYRRLNQDATGTFGPVKVEDDEPVQVVSIALKGSYRKKNFDEAAEQLRQWLTKHPEWQTAGPVRVLAYNSPFMFFWNKYSEVQIPVRPAVTDDAGKK